MSKVSKHFKQAIENFLNEQASNDPLIAETLKKEGKTIDECINYILTEVKKSGQEGFTDDEVYNMALHYYDEDNLGNIEKLSANVKVNYVPELTKEEQEDLKKKAREQVIEQEKRKMIRKKTPTSDSKPKTEQTSLF